MRTKVLMLSATPVNNRFIDLKNQLALAYEGDAEQINQKLATTKSIDEIFRQAQKAFNAWSKLPAEQRTTDALLRTLDFDFFELLDSVTIARSRKHIEKYYNTADIGKFPERLPPISLRPCLTDLSDAINYNDIYTLLMSLNLSIYTPSNYIMPSRLAKYLDMTHHKGTSLTQQGREEGIRRLMSINLLKRLESSVYSFRLTIDRIKKLIEDTIVTINNYQSGDCVLNLTELSDNEDFDYDDQNTDFFSVGKKVKIDLADMDYVSWKRELEKDAENLELLSLMVADITPEHDTKLQTLFDLIQKKMEHPINPGNRKIIIFTAFSDTADYLYANVSRFAKGEVRAGNSRDHRHSGRQNHNTKAPRRSQHCPNLFLTGLERQSRFASGERRRAGHSHCHRLYFRRTELTGLRLSDQLRHSLEPCPHHPAFRTD